MTQTSARILLDSITEEGYRLTTMEVIFHRFVLAEFNTHRVFSRNSASSRAIPVEKMLGRFRDDFAFPLSLPSEQPGMQGGTELEGRYRVDAENLINDIKEATTLLIHDYLASHPDKSTRLHKSVLNRPMEWGQWHTVIVSATEFQNFFDQRCSPLAQPEIRAAAELMMHEAYENSTPTLLLPGQWATPLILPEEYEELTLPDRLKISAARCGRVSYLTHDGVRDTKEDLALFDRLASADPMHASPFEHVATPALKGAPTLGNFEGWRQLRHNLDVVGLDW